MNKNFLKIFENSFGLKLDGTKLKGPYRKLELFHPSRLMAIGALYEMQNGNPKKYREAIKCYLIAAMLGDRSGLARVGILTYYGNGISKDTALALHLMESFHKWATKADTLTIGIMLYNHKNPKYRKLSQFCLRKIAISGNGEANFYLGTSYDFGENGINQNKKMAIKKYLLAAKDGHLDSQFNLARSFEIGDGTPKNRNKALYWYRKLAKKGSKEAAKAIKKLEKDTKSTS